MSPLAMSPLAMKLLLLGVLTFALGGTTASRSLAAEGWSAHVIAEVSGEEATIEAFAVGDFNADRHPDLAAILHRPNGTALLRVFIHPGPANATTRWPSVDVATFDASHDTPPGDLVVARFDVGQLEYNFGGGPISQIVTSRASAEVPLVAHHPPRAPANVLKPDAWFNVQIPLDVKLFSPSGERAPAPLRLAAASINDRPGAELVVATAPVQIVSQVSNNSSLDVAYDPGQIGWLERPAMPPVRRGTLPPVAEGADEGRLAPWKFHPLAPFGTSKPIVAADLTRDGDTDLVWIHADPDDLKLSHPGIHWLTNPGPQKTRQTDAWLHTQIGPDQTNLTQLAVGDLGDDGLLDVAAATDANRIPLYIQHAPRPPGWKPYPIPAPSKAPLGTAVALFDLNSDGQTDLIHATAAPPETDAVESDLSEVEASETTPGEPQPPDEQPDEQPDMSPHRAPAAITWYVQIRIGEIPAWVAEPVAQSKTGRYLQLHPADIDQDGAVDLLTLLQAEGVSRLLWLTP